jgi:hypothetical protein
MAPGNKVFRDCRGDGKRNSSVVMERVVEKLDRGTEKAEKVAHEACIIE